MNMWTGRSAGLALLAGILAGCGGGSDGGSGGNDQQAGSSEVRQLGAVKLTDSSVQTLTRSTNDLLATPGQRGPEAAIAYGLAPVERGLAEVRVAREPDGVVTRLNLLLSDLGMSWDGRTERPPIIETFGLSRGRVIASSTGLATLEPLPAASDTAFWNNNPTTLSGTQANYANNIYFARQPSTDHCTAGDNACVTAAGNGLRLQRGDWRSGGLRPDQVTAARLHEDGATMAPDQIPFPGFKGYRDIWNWNYQYTQLAGWITQDTLAIIEWGGNDEHNSARRGVTAFGEVTPASAIPTTGSARYLGLARGWYSPDGRVEPYPIAADVEITVDFAARTTRIRLSNLRVDEAQTPSPQLAAESINTLPFGNPRNTMLGAVSHGDASGHAGARFFGPVTGGAPAEIGGAFSVRAASASPIVDAVFGAGGFIARRAP